jgi:copper chaperone CopZ
LQRVGSALKRIEGVLKHSANLSERTLVIIFDDRVTTVEKILWQLAEASYSISGKPQMIL